jgi:hypothetical protein
LIVKGVIVMELNNKKMLERDGMESDCNSATDKWQGKLEKNPIFLSSPWCSLCLVYFSLCGL